mgnify:CR=1 FL=1
MLTITEALKTPITGLNVMVIGLPGSGKTFFAGWLAFNNPGHVLFNTDDYLKDYNSQEFMYAALEEVTDNISNGNHTIVEGVAGYRMLRKGAQLGTYFPDIVFEIIAPTEQRERVYQQERSDRNFTNVQKFDKALTTVLNDYKNTIGDFEFPTWIQVNNQFP